MKIREKIYMTVEQLIEEGPITIVVLGDSVTHGALLNTINYDTVYWSLLRKKINNIRDYVPVNIINAGISGTTATLGAERLEKQVLSHNPDLVIVCFGLNDVNYPIDDYDLALREIFTKCKKAGADVVFMTPNMLNTYVADDTDDSLKEYAAQTAQYQNEGRMDEFMRRGISAAEESGALVCDVYSKWKKLNETQDTTLLLINRINHPIAQMHELFADSLFELLFCGLETANSDSTMIKKK